MAAMRLLLQQRPSAGEAPKYVQLMLQQDLLGGWTLLRETGQIGGSRPSSSASNTSSATPPCWP